MEKIKKAIEESKRSAAKSTSVKNGYKDVEVKAPAAPRTDNLDATSFTYEKTQVISLKPDHLTKNRIVSFNKNDHLSLGFDILRTQVLKKMKENGWRTLAITSPTPSCGKSVIAINLAMSIAHHTSTTSMLVDFDLRRPSVSKYLGLPPGPSLNDVLSGDALIEDVLINPGLERLVIMPTSRPVKHSSEVLSSQKISNMVTELRERYSERIVIFDLSPILGIDDAINIVPQVDCVLVVVGNGMASKSELVETMRHIDSSKLLGTVLNKSESTNHNEYYDY